MRCDSFLASVSETVFSDDGDPRCVPCRARIDRRARSFVIASSWVAITLGGLGTLMMIGQVGLVLFRLATMPR